MARIPDLDEFGADPARSKASIMRKFVSIVSSAGLSVLALQAFHAPGGAAPGGKTKITSFVSGSVDGEPMTINGLLRFKYSGTKVASAVLDLCLPSKTIGAQDDRVVVPLQVGAGGRLTSDKTSGAIGPVKLRFQGGDEIRLDGSIRRGEATILVKEDNLTLSEETPPEPAGQPTEEASNDTSTTTTNMTFDIRPRNIGAAVKALKAYPVSISGRSLIPACQDLRDDKVNVFLTVPPKRVDEMVKVVEAIPNVKNVQKGTGSFSRSDGILVPKAEGAGGPAAILRRASKVIERETGGKVTSMREDETTGSTTLQVLLPPETLGGLALKKQVTIEALVEPAADVAGAHVLFWRLQNYKLSPDEPGLKLKLEDISLGGEESAGEELTPWKAQMAREFGGKAWDSERRTWKSRSP